ncbi:MAG: glutathione S-transferase family protein [Alphaproteobacteria bacterium]|nr:glutathione S-transferase family protein [Alphaproteobacteria bacterium]
MRILYHLWLQPRCRVVRLALAEKGLGFEAALEKIWERRPEFLAMNPAGDVPVLVEDGQAIVGVDAICTYVEDLYPEPPLYGRTAIEGAEIRRLVAWFDEKFAREVTDNLVGEKVMKRFLGQGTPNSAAIRAGAANLRVHLDYVSWLAERRDWLAGSALSLADVAAGAQISCLDYIAAVPWDEYPKAKAWYARLKSRPSFRTVLADLVPGLPPPKHYADLDF